MIINIKYYIILMAVAVSCSQGGQADTDLSTLPAAPDGYKWFGSTDGTGSFLEPDGWFVLEESSGNTDALFITRENIETEGGYLVGLSVNRINHFSRTRSTEPSDYAVSLAHELASSGELLMQRVETNTAGDMNIVRVKQAVNGNNIITHYIILGLDSADQVYIIMFEAPESLWAEQEATGEQMLDFFILGDEPAIK